MAFEDNERLQEMVLVAGDKISLVDKKWWYALFIVIVAAAPLYLGLKAGFVQLALSNYEVPRIIHTTAVKQPLEVIGKGIFDLGNNSYSAYVRIKNIEFDWGVASQQYTAEFKTLGGTSVTKVPGSTFILPAREKLIVFSRFSPEQKPEQLIFSLGETRFIHRPQFDFDYDLERVSVQNRSGVFVVSAAVKNKTPFTVKEINLPMALFDNKGQIINVNFTSVNDVLSGETRTFQYTPLPAKGYTGTPRAEISPEVNIFDKNIFQIAPGGQSF